MSDELLITHDQLCMQCGYNLRGLAMAGACPECGHAIALSLQGDWLRFAERRWLRRIARGCAITDVCSRLFLYAYIGMMVALLALFTTGLVGPRGIGDFIAVIGRAFLTALFLAIAGGVWMMTSTEPRHQDRDVTNRMLLRTLALLAVPAFAICSSRFRQQLPMFGLGPLSEQLIIHICFIIVWLQIATILILRASLRQRCVDASQHRGTQTDSSWRIAIAFGIFFLLLYWWGPIRWNDSGSWSMPGPKAKGNLTLVTFIGWLIAVRSLARLKPLIHRELEFSAKMQG